MAKNCTCSLLLETIDKIFIDDSCCCLSTVVTPTDNCCNCEPIIDFIDTDKFACASFDNNRNLKYQMIRESWLVTGTNSKTVYDAIIEALASEIMLLLKVLGGGVDDNTKNYITSPVEIAQDVASGLYIVKYFKFIEGNLHICTYTIHKVDLDNYETSWESDVLDSFDASQYYTKIECDDKFATRQYVETNYFNKTYITQNFYTKNDVYTKNEVYTKNLVDERILWKQGAGELSTLRKNVGCETNGNYSIAAGRNNKANGDYSTTFGYGNLADGSYSSILGNGNYIYSDHSFIAGAYNKIGEYGSCNFSTAVGTSNKIGNNLNNESSKNSFAAGVGNKINGDSSCAVGGNNEVTGKYTFTSGSNNIVYGDSNIVAGSENKVNRDNTSLKGNVVTGVGNIIDSSYSGAVGRQNTILGAECNFAGGASNTINSLQVANPGDETVTSYNVSFGHGNELFGSNSTAFGDHNRAAGSCLFVEGTLNVIENKVGNKYKRVYSSAAIGERNEIKGSYSGAFGYKNAVNKSAAFAIGNKNYAKHAASVAINDNTRATGISSLAGGRRSYTEYTGSCAIGSPVGVLYFAKLLKNTDNTNDPDYGYLVLTDAEGTEITSINTNSILYKRFTFNLPYPLKESEDSSYYCGELSIMLTQDESENSEYLEKFPEKGTWVSLKTVELNNEDLLIFKPESNVDNIVWLFRNSSYNNTGWVDGVRVIDYASGYDACKAVGIGAHAEGYGTMAKGTGSHSEGINTFVLNAGEHACGKYNYSSAASENYGNGTLFSVGIGAQEYLQLNSKDVLGANLVITRKNALEITNNGKIYIRFKDNHDVENVYDLGALLNILIDNIDVSSAIDSSRSEEENNNDTSNILAIKNK